MLPKPSSAISVSLLSVLSNGVSANSKGLFLGSFRYYTLVGSQRSACARLVETWTHFSGREKAVFTKTNIQALGISPLFSHFNMSTRAGSSKTTSSDVDNDIITDAREIFIYAVNSVLPHEMIGNKLNFNPSISVLQVDGHVYKLKKNVHVVGFGKAVLGMARAVEDCIGEHIVQGIISIPLGAQEALRKEGKLEMLLYPDSKICVMEGAENNLPDEAAERTATEIASIIKQAGEGDILMVLISGGGSALLPAPKPPVTLSDMLMVTQLMARAGASIMHLNTVRKHIDLLKGGGLARLAHPAQVISLILSDVIGDPLDFIASGPTVPDHSTPQECLDLFRSLGIEKSVPYSVLKLLQEELQQSNSSEKPEVEERKMWSHVQNLLVGTNKIACDAACNKSSLLGYLPYILSTELSGEAQNIGKMFVHLSHYIIQCFLSSDPARCVEDLNETEALLISEFKLSSSSLQDIREHVKKSELSESKGICIVAGGETTVTVRGKGKGGRNQEMTAVAALELSRKFSAAHHSSARVVFLSAGTDGQDGPTSAAGGVISMGFASKADASGINVQDYLDRNDSYTLFTQVDGGSHLVITGLTGTNVMDIQILLVRKIGDS